MEKNSSDIDIPLKQCIEKLSHRFLAPFDLLPHSDLREKFIDLVLNGEPDNLDSDTIKQFHILRHELTEKRVDQVRVVVFGGGSGLSNVIGGDSRMVGWSKEPFSGIKEVFPKTMSIVCVTDDGGSTGELIKDIPLIALGDIRHVLLSSVQLRLIQKKYSLTVFEAREVVASLAYIFNLRFKIDELSLTIIDELCGSYLAVLPIQLREYLAVLFENIFTDKRLNLTTARSHCLGNLLLASSIYLNISKTLDNEELEMNSEIIDKAFYKGIRKLTEIIGAGERAVLPCTTTPSQLRVRYLNGVQVIGESKSGNALRGYPVDRVFVDFSYNVKTNEQVIEDIRKADIIIMAPGSLYSSIIPIFQVPGMARAVRSNKHALKMLISNLWVQAGETDKSISDPERKFHVSDMIRAYERNIPGGTKNLFHEVLCLSLKDVPASILQNYAVEGKIPIYLDKNIVCGQGFVPIECGIYSKKALDERGVIQHDPDILALAVKTIYVGSKFLQKNSNTYQIENTRSESSEHSRVNHSYLPSEKYRKIKLFIKRLPIKFFPGNSEKIESDEVVSSILGIVWKHQDIPLSHMQYITGIVCVDKSEWRREQKWDKVFSFFDPLDSCIKIRSDQFADIRKLEVAFLVALGQSLLGNYAEKKEVKPVTVSGVEVGKIYHLHLRKKDEMRCYFNADDLSLYLYLARMWQSGESPTHFTRLISGKEGFTPPGLLMGLLYAWYLDNRLATHIEYKMALMQIRKSDLIPEQQKMLARRELLIRFFREIVFSP